MALPGSGSFDPVMPVVEMVFSLSKAGHECSRSVDASRAALRRPEVREQIELFWSQAPPVPSEHSVDEHAELLAKAARVAWRRAAPRVQPAPQADWMDEEGGKKSTPKGQPVSPSSMAQDVGGGEARQ